MSGLLGVNALLTVGDGINVASVNRVGRHYRPDSRRVKPAPDGHVDPKAPMTGICRRRLVISRNRETSGRRPAAIY